jgi:hypothetical protein
MEMTSRKVRQAVKNPAPRVTPRARATPRRTHWVSSKLETKIRLEKGGYGLRATQPIQRGELLVMWGGDVVSGEALLGLSPVAKRHSIQVEEDLYMVPHQLPEPGDFVNHSCDPNAGMTGQAGLVALRHIMPGEEVCFDYAMSDGSSYDEFDCSCGSPVCRGRITGNDWMLPALQLRYSGFFSPYLQRRIEEARRHGTLHLPTSLASLLAEASS